MKKTLLSLAALLLSTGAFTQDVCDELMKLNDPKKSLNRSYRMTSKSEAMGQTHVMEHDKNGNIYQNITMNMAGQNMKIESIIVGNMMYSNKNDEGWVPQKLDSAQLATLKSQATSGQMQYFKNCEKLANETIDSKDYRVYTGDFDGDKMVEMMTKGAKLTGQEIPPNLEMMRTMEMHMKFYINSGNDVEKLNMSIAVMGRTIESAASFEYDIPVTIAPPPPPAPLSQPLPKKN